jgi:hypothetical protein
MGMGTRLMGRGLVTVNHPSYTFQAFRPPCSLGFIALQVPIHKADMKGKPVIVMISSHYR